MKINELQYKIIEIKTLAQNQYLITAKNNLNQIETFSLKNNQILNISRATQLLKNNQIYDISSLDQLILAQAISQINSHA